MMMMMMIRSISTRIIQIITENVNTSIQFAIFSLSERISAKHLVPNTFLITSINKNIKKQNCKYYLIILCNPELGLPDDSDYDNDDNDNAGPPQQEVGPESSGSKEMCGVAVVFYIVRCLKHFYNHGNHHHHHQHH